MLAEFEQVEETQKEIDQLNISEDDQHKYIRQQKNKRKLETLPVAFTSSSNLEKTVTEPRSSKIEAIEQTMLGSVESKEKKRGTHVVLEFNFHSNWGSQDQIGLTEVEFIFLFRLSFENKNLDIFLKFETR